MFVPVCKTSRTTSQGSNITTACCKHETEKNWQFTLDKSTSSAVQKDASAFLYICHMS